MPERRSNPSWLERLRLEGGAFSTIENTDSLQSIQSLKLFKLKKVIITNNETEENDPLISEARRHLSIITQFEQSQLILQSASLSSFKEICDKEKVVSNYLAAITKMLDQNEMLSIKLLCEIHKILMTGLIIGEGIGVLRTKKNKVGNKTFCDPSQVYSQINLFLGFVEEVMKRDDIDMFSKAAMISLSFVDIHPFKDGNGRFMRILVNWVLKRCGQPFPISLCSTLDHRNKYIKAIRDCCDGAKPKVNPFAIFLAFCCNLDWQEVGRKLYKMTKGDSDDVVIRKAREELRGIDCLICHEPFPNMCVLCCGAAVHINCMVDWLATAAIPTCVNCRAELPVVKRRLQQDVQQMDEEDTETMGEGEYDVIFDAAIEAIVHDNNGNNIQDNSTSDEEDGGDQDTGTIDDEDDGIVVILPQQQDFQDTETLDDEDDSNVVILPQQPDMHDTETVDDDADDNIVIEDEETESIGDDNDCPVILGSRVITVVDEDTMSTSDSDGGDNQRFIYQGTIDVDANDNDSDVDSDNNGFAIVAEDTVSVDDDNASRSDEDTETVQDAADNENVAIDEDTVSIDEVNPADVDEQQDGEDTVSVEDVDQVSVDEQEQEGEGEDTETMDEESHGNSSASEEDQIGSDSSDESEDY